MVMWQLLFIIGLFFLVLEMFNPVMFFMNFAFSAFITAGISFFVDDINLLMSVFAVLSLVLLVLVRPIFMNKISSKEQKTGIDSKYIGKTAKVIEPITQSSGAISIYDERWNARTIDSKEIPTGKIVKIIKNDSLVMYVEEEE